MSSSTSSSDNHKICTQCIFLLNLITVSQDYHDGNGSASAMHHPLSSSPPSNGVNGGGSSSGRGIGHANNSNASAPTMLKRIFSTVSTARAYNRLHSFMHAVRNFVCKCARTEQCEQCHIENRAPNSTQCTSVGTVCACYFRIFAQNATFPSHSRSANFDDKAAECRKRFRQSIETESNAMKIGNLLSSS